MPTLPRRFFPSSLRGKLTTQLILLAAVVCLVVGVATEVALSEFLLHKVDDQLSAASERGQNPPPRGPVELLPGTSPPPDALRAFGQGVGTLAMHITPNGTTTVGVLAVNSGEPLGPGQPPVQPISPAQIAVLVQVPRDGHKYTRDLGPALGEYRVVAIENRDGEVAITGLPLADVSNTLWRLGFVLGGVALAGLTLAGAVGAVTVRRTMQPLERLARTAAQVSELRLDKGDVALGVQVAEADTDARTEVGKLGSAFGRMLGNVAAALAARQASESRVRQFVADASHELRTPLAAIRGYAELTRRRRDSVPPDIAFALGRVEAESARMTTLVEDLLLLARLDAGRHQVYEPVDLSRLVTDAVADAHVFSPHHRWLLDVPAEPITVVGDADQLHQVVINLLNNARMHTPPKTVVTTKLSAERGRVTLTVRDNGPGIPQDALPEVFERFARGDSSRSRAAGSTGLGLAIVAAVVSAHGGQVSVRSEPGETEFTVRFLLSSLA
ncbi:two-component sensor histidine kinase [Amycolatopsis taiwanensis]|uniref:histidine kinase n=1 Tax=Amycolatopsis taiwanensis TaxID=342230 RepID=A0A9W6VJS8_9PSEU|nr:two-component sensor histidine kinase [Amycolatopsis taiwanensis]